MNLYGSFTANVHQTNNLQLGIAATYLKTKLEIIT